MKRLVLALLLCTLPAIAQTAHNITLGWAADASATGGFLIFRGTTSGGPYTQIGTVPANTLTYVDSTGVAGTQYFYVIAAIDTATPPDQSAYSTQVSGTYKGNPATPTNVTVTVN